MVEKKPTIHRKAAAIAEVLGIPYRKGDVALQTLLRIRSLDDDDWRRLQGKYSEGSKQQRQVRGAPWLYHRDSKDYAYKAVADREDELMSAFLEGLGLYLNYRTDDLKPKFEAAAPVKARQSQAPSPPQREAIGPSVTTARSVLADKAISSESRLPETKGTGPSRTKVAMYAGVALGLIAAGIVSFVVLRQQSAGENNTLTEVCGHSNTPLTARIIEVSSPPTIWATAAKLPDDLLDKLNAKDQQVTVDQILQPYDPIKESGGGRHRLILIGQCKRPVILTKIRSQIISKSAPLSGGYVFMPSQGDVDVKSAVLDLDAPSGTEALEYDSQQQKVKGPFFDNKIATVTDGETYPIDLYGQTKSSAVHWKVVVDAIIDDSDISIEVDLPGNKPLTNTATIDAYESSFVFNVGSFTWENLKGKLE